MIQIGQICKAQGIRGELKVRPLTDDVERFGKLKEVFVENTSFHVVSVRIREGFAYLTLTEISDRTAAEGMRGKFLSVNRAHAVKLERGRYFITEMLGSSVYVGETLLGKIDSIDNYGSADIYTVVGAKTVRFPLLNDLIETIDTEKKVMRLYEKRFGEVAVYED